MWTSSLVAELVPGFGFCVSVTVTVNASELGDAGASNVGCTAVSSDNTTGAPLVCVHS